MTNEKNLDPKNAAADSELGEIVKKHVSALTRDITDELTRLFVGRLFTAQTNDANAANDDQATDPPAIPWVSPTYNTKTRRWGCPRCRDYFDLRKRGVTTHIRYCTGSSPIPSAVRAKFTPAMSKKSRKKK